VGFADKRIRKKIASVYKKTFVHSYSVVIAINSNMNVKIGVLIFLFVSFQNTLAQGPLNCVYKLENRVYFCDLSISNAKGFDNFTEISGSHLSRNLNKDVVKVTIVTGSISTNIPSIICEKFINVKEITLANIGLEIIGENSFKNCIKIETISLSDNKIKEVNALAFNENLELDSLTLESTQLTTLPEELFTNQLKLTSLYIGNNKISDMPNRIFDPLQNLIILDLSNNDIVNPKAEWFKMLANLEKLFLNDNKIIELPVDVFKLLQFLDLLLLSNNNISVIESKSFGTLPALNIVELQQNRISAIDAQFISNTGVTILDVSQNICINKTIEDSSPERGTMKSDLKNCFDNFELLKSKHNFSDNILCFT